MRQHGWSSAQIGAVHLGLGRTSKANSRIKGYAGWLATEPLFLEQQIRSLEARWNALPEGQRPAFPLLRAVRTRVTPDGAVPAPDALRAFSDDLAAFLDRWGLTQLATWDLPMAQGPILPVLLDADAPAVPRHGLHLFLPLHYPLTGDDDLLGEILRLQQSSVEGLGLDTSLAGLPHHEAYSQILELVHLERAITSRFDGRKPRGFISHLEEAIAESLGVSIAHVQRMRKAVARCRRGERSQVRWLRA
jgi:hypothetical protein